MRAKFVMKLITGLVLLSLLAAMPLLAACGGDTETTTSSPTTTTTTTTPTETKAEFDVVKTAVASYLGSTAPNMKAADLQMRIADGDSPYIVSIRSADDYAAGHIPGAVNLKFSELTTIPTGEEVLVYC